MNELLKMCWEWEKQVCYDVILDVVELVFLEKGYECIFMDDIVCIVSFSWVLLYVYFKDKVVIQWGIMFWVGQSLVVYFEEVRNSVDIGFGQIVVMGEVYYWFYQDELDYFFVFIQVLMVMLEVDENLVEDMLCVKFDLMELMIGVIWFGLEDGMFNWDCIVDLE